MVNGLVIVTAVMLIVSKFLDCYTTDVKASKTADKAGYEVNPLTRCLMIKLGFRNVIWWGFVLISIFVSLIAYEVMTENNIYYSIGYISLGFTISLAQFDVAGHNYYNTQSFFTRTLWKIYSIFNK
ncbi:MAG: hypothetical protein WC644_01735 [Ignavibacteria bacterium]